MEGERKQERKGRKQAGRESGGPLATVVKRARA